MINAFRQLSKSLSWRSSPDLRVVSQISQILRDCQSNPTNETPESIGCFVATTANHLTQARTDNPVLWSSFKTFFEQTITSHPQAQEIFNPNWTALFLVSLANSKHYSSTLLYQALSHLSNAPPSSLRPQQIGMIFSAISKSLPLHPRITPEMWQFLLDATLLHLNDFDSHNLALATCALDSLGAPDSTIHILYTAIQRNNILSSCLPRECAALFSCISKRFPNNVPSLYALCRATILPLPSEDFPCLPPRKSLPSALEDSPRLPAGNSPPTLPPPSHLFSSSEVSPPPRPPLPEPQDREVTVCMNSIVTFLQACSKRRFSLDHKGKSALIAILLQDAYCKELSPIGTVLLLHSTARLKIALPEETIAKVLENLPLSSFSTLCQKSVVMLFYALASHRYRDVFFTAHLLKYTLKEHYALSPSPPANASSPLLVSPIHTNPLRYHLPSQGHKGVINLLMIVSALAKMDVKIDNDITQILYAIISQHLPQFKAEDASFLSGALLWNFSSFPRPYPTIHFLSLLSPSSLTKLLLNSPEIHHTIAALLQYEAGQLFASTPSTSLDSSARASRSQQVPLSTLETTMKAAKEVVVSEGRDKQQAGYERFRLWCKQEGESAALMKGELLEIEVLRTLCDTLSLRDPGAGGEAFGDEQVGEDSMGKWKGMRRAASGNITMAFSHPHYKDLSLSNSLQQFYTPFLLTRRVSD